MAETHQNDQPAKVGFSDGGVPEGSPVERKLLDMLEKQNRTLPDPTPGFSETVPGGVYGFQGRDGKVTYRNAENKPCKKDGTIIGD